MNFWLGTIVVIMATKLASSLKRLSKRRTKALWTTLAKRNPKRHQPDKGADAEEGGVMPAEFEERRA